MEKRIYIHAFNKVEVINFYKGYYNGIEFVPKLGFCGSIDELYNYNYVQFYRNDGLIAHIPKKYTGDLEIKMKDAFVRIYGEVEQVTLF